MVWTQRRRSSLERTARNLDRCPHGVLTYSDLPSVDVILKYIPTYTMPHWHSSMFHGNIYSIYTLWLKGNLKNILFIQPYKKKCWNILLYLIFQLFYMPRNRRFSIKLKYVIYYILSYLVLFSEVFINKPHYPVSYYQKTRCIFSSYIILFPYFD